MRKVAMAVLALVVLASAGCGGMYCKAGMAQTIDANAIQAGIDKGLVVVGAMTDAQATLILKDNALKFAAYADAKTVNLFEYLFGKATILVNGEYAERLDRARVLSATTATRADLPETSIGFRYAAVIEESDVMGYVKDAKDGRRSQ